MSHQSSTGRRMAVYGVFHLRTTIDGRTFQRCNEPRSCRFRPTDPTSKKGPVGELRPGGNIDHEKGSASKLDPPGGTRRGPTRRTDITHGHAMAHDQTNLATLMALSYPHGYRRDTGGRQGAASQPLDYEG